MVGLSDLPPSSFPPPVTKFMSRFANDGFRFFPEVPLPPSEDTLSGVTSRLWLEDFDGEAARFGMLILLRPLLSGERDLSLGDSSRKLCETLVLADFKNGEAC